MSGMKKVVDYLVVGGGTGGLSSAREAAKAGATVALVEGRKIGGTCTNVGCIPKKLTWYAGNLIHDLKAASDFGLSCSYEFAYQTLKKNRDALTENIDQNYQEKLCREGVEFIRGSASFVDKNTVCVEGAGLISASHILIATGARSMLPPVDGYEHLLTSDDFFRLEHLPQEVLIIGNGYIACELAGMFNSFGVDTTMAIMESNFLEGFDQSLAGILKECYEENGIQLYFEKTSTEVRKENSKLTVSFNDGTELSSQMVFAAVGRKANFQKLGIDKVHLELDDFGALKVDEFQNTSVEGIYALGDVTSNPQLTPVAKQAGKKLAYRLFGSEPQAKVDLSFVPTVVFSHPPLGSVGLTEDKALDKYGESMKVYHTRFTDLYHMMSSTKQPSLVKIIADGKTPDSNVVGLHAVGKGVDEMMQGFSVAVSKNLTVRELKNSISIHPTSAEEFLASV